MLAAADVIGSSYQDVIVGGLGEDSDAGIFYLFPGALAGPTTGFYYKQSATLVLAESEAGDDFGAAFAAGDVDGNGRLDLIVGSPGEGANGAPADSGLIGLYYGSAGGIDTGFYRTQEEVQSGAQSEANDRFGAAVAAGDFNGNGRDEIAIGAPGEAPGSDPAGGYLFVVEYGLYRLTHGPILGAITHSSVKVWARGNRFAELEVTREVPNAGFHLGFSAGNLSSTDDYTGVVELTGLAPDTEYDYTVRFAGQEMFAGKFRTLPSPIGSSQISFSYGADSHWRHRPFAAYGVVEDLAPDFVIMGGDNIYADDVDITTTGYRHRYRETFGETNLRSLMKDIPVFMTWDDHEVINDWYPDNDGGRYAVAREAFDEWQMSHNPDPIVPGEVYYSFTAGEVDFFVLDTRSHRNPGVTMLGAEQLDELLDWLDASDGKFKFIVSSVPFDWRANTPDNDPWNGFEDERDLIFAHIQANAIPGVLLLSGDQHWSAVFRSQLGGYTTYEFMPTPVGVDTRSTSVVAGGDVLYVDQAHRGLGHFEIDTAVSPATLEYSWIDEDGAVLYNTTITEDDIGF